MSGAPTQAPDARDRAVEHIDNGFAIIWLPPKEKAPAEDNWPDKRITVREDVPRYFSRNSNIGLVLAVNREADIDLDSGFAVRIGPLMLPSTPAVYGRPSRPASHWLFRLDRSLPSRRYKDPVDGEVQLEFRCATREGGIGLQSVGPGSVHPTDEPIEWSNSGPHWPAEVNGEALRRTTARIAAACLLAKYWPEKGNRHNAQLALGGALAHAGWGEEETFAFVHAVVANARTGDRERTAQVRRDTADTFRAHLSGSPTTGLPTLSMHFPKAVIDAVVAWLELPARPRVDLPEWPDPLPLESPLPPVDPFDLGLLPAAFHSFVDDVSDRMQVVPDFVAIPLLVAYAATVGRRVRIQPKAVDSTWLVVPNMWGAIVGPPGFLKTPCIAAATAPLQALEEKGRSEYTTAMTEYEDQLQDHELQVNVWKGQAKKAYRTKTVPPEKPDKVPEKPLRKRYITNDATYEALHGLLSENPAGVLAQRDELSGWLAQLDKPGREGDRAFWLEAWNGTGSFTMDRIGRGSVSTDSCCVSLMGGIQPARLRSYLSQALVDGPGNDGLIQRFQMLVWPDLTGTWKYLDRLPNEKAMSAVTEVFRRVISLDPGTPKMMKFDAAAQELFAYWLPRLEADIRGDELHPALVSHIAKYRSLMPTLAGLFEIADDAQSARISLRHAQQAADACEYLRTHAERLYSCVVSAAVHLATDLAAKIRAGKLGTVSFTLREVYLKGWTGMDAPETVRSAVEILVDAHWLRAAEHTPSERGGRPSDKYLINPKVLDGQV